MLMVMKNAIKAQHFFELAYPTLNTQSEFLSDYYFYLLEIGHKDKAKSILDKLLEIDPSNETWHDEAMRINLKWVNTNE